MDMIVGMELRLKADQARAALADVKTDVKGLGAEARTASVDGARLGETIEQGSSSAAPAVAALEAQLADLRAQLMSVTAAESAARQQTEAMIAKIAALEAQFGRGGRGGGTGAAGAVGNLTAQFNDLGMMTAAGQNPLQLAIQQGSQITQIFGQMGAAGAVKALGAAFLQMLSPVNLATYAAIAAGAALVQWLMDTGEAAKSAEDAVGDLEAAVKHLGETGGRSFEDLKKDFGAITPEVARLNREIAELANVQAILATKEAFAALKGEVEGAWLATDDGQVAEILGVRLQTVLPGSSADGVADIGINPTISQFQASLAELQDARGADAQLAVLRDLNAQFVAAAGGIDAMTVEQTQYYGQLVATEAAVRRIVVAQEAAARAQLELRRAAEVENDRMGGPTRFDGPTGPAPADRAAAMAEGRAIIADLERQAHLQALINVYGEDSVQVARARAKAERDAFVATTLAGDASAELKAEMIAAYDAAQNLSGVDVAAVFAAGKVEAGGLVQELIAAVAAAANLKTSGPGAGWLAGAISDASRLGTILWDAAAAAKASADATTAAELQGVPTSPDQVVSRLQGGGAFTPRVRGAGLPTPDTGAGSAGGGRSGGGGDLEGLAALSREAEQAMATLETAIAAINEKVRLGLMSTADGTRAIAAAKEQAANAIADLIPKIERASDAAGPKAAAAVARWRAEVQGLNVELTDAASTLSSALSDNFEKGFAAFLAGAKRGKAAMADFKNFILQQLAEIASQKFTSAVISPLINSIAGGLNLAPPASAAYALGGIPEGPGISAWSGQIVDRPTLFPMAKGAYGLMGEAGPEAVMPLARGADGKLGVRVQGGAATDAAAIAERILQGLAPVPASRPMAVPETLAARPNFFPVQRRASTANEAANPEQEVRHPATLRGRDANGPVINSIAGGLNLAPPASAAYALGGIPEGPGISAWSGQIVDRPTLFPMAKGAYGLMGEAGPEAVMPLARGADGKLGVRVQGGAATDAAAIAERILQGLAPVPASRPMVVPETLADRPNFFPVQRRASTANEAANPQQEVRHPATLRGRDANGPARADGQRPVTLIVNNMGEPAKARVAERREAGEDIITVILEKVDAHIAGNIAQGRGMTPDAMASTFGLSRQGR